jgi:hypothetical protein
MLREDECYFCSFLMYYLKMLLFVTCVLYVVHLLHSKTSLKYELLSLFQVQKYRICSNSSRPRFEATALIQTIIRLMFLFVNLTFPVSS